MFSNTTFKGKTILITGGGSGLGLSMGKKLAELGASIAICGRTEEKLQSAAEELSSLGAEVFTHSVDVREYKAVGKMFKELNSQCKQIDALINNAAGNFYSCSEDLSPGGFKAVIDIVLHGTFNCSQHFGKYLIDNKLAGNILNIVTTYTQTGSSFVLPSACAKAGVAAMTNTLAYEWAPYNIRVNSIAPGPFPTEGAWSRLMPKEFEKLCKSRHPMKRFGETEELANLAAFILSDMAPYINGECITIDGGASLDAGTFNFVSQMMPRGELKDLFKKIRQTKSTG